MYSLWNFLLTRSAFTKLLIVALVVSGVYALIAMPKESTPEIKVPIGIVTTVLPGATAADVERLITDELEPAVRNVDNIDKVTSQSRAGVSVITAEFIASADTETSIQDLRNAVEGAKRDLPTDAESPTVTKIDFSNQPVLMVAIGSDLHPAALTKLGEDLKDDLVNVSGISKVEIAGTRDREIALITNSDALLQYGISPLQIVGAISAANASVPVGSLTIDNVSYPIQFKGDITSIEDIKNAPLQTSGGTIKVSDVANVIDGFDEAVTISRLYVEGKETQFALTLNIYKSSGGNILTAADNAKNRLKELESTLLSGSEYVVTYDSSDDVRKSINELTRAGIETIVLVGVLLLVTIGLRESIVAVLSIPLSFVIAFIGMWMTGNTINFISLFALIIAIGVLVDSGIVVVEGIHTNREKGMDKMAAAQKAIRDFAWPLIAGTMTTVAVFLPLFFLSGILGQYVKGIPFTIVMVLIASIVVALGFVPLIALYILKHQESAFSVYREKLWHSLEVWYEGMLKQFFHVKKLRVSFYLFLTIALGGGFALVGTGTLPAILFANDDVNYFTVDVELPQASTLAATDEVAREVEEFIQKETPFLTSVQTTVGGTSALSQNPQSGGKYASFTVNLVDTKQRETTSEEITKALRAKLATKTWPNSATVRIADVAAGPPSEAPVVIKVWSNDSAKLAEATEIVENALKKAGSTRDVTSSLTNDGTELAIRIDRDRARDYGLSTVDVAQTLRSAIAGIEATKVRIDGDDINVRVRVALNEDYVQPEDTIITTADSVAQIPIATVRGNVPLGTFLSTTANRNSSVINHEDGMRVSTVNAQLTPGGNAIEITTAFAANEAKLDLPEGVSLTYGGDSEQIQKTFTEMGVALISGIVLMFAIIVLEFNAIAQSGRLLAIVPLSLAGVLWMLFFMGQPLSFTAFLGIIALAGVLINHGILLIDGINARKKRAEYADAETLILEAATSRLRPIILTTIATSAGMVPLTLVNATWAPLAYTIMGGLLYGTILTLIYVPLRSLSAEQNVGQPSIFSRIFRRLFRS
jgi:hydrophobic/amphiphilic exporter-1 (mainly G- bacteria), HAE1 family